MTHSTATTFRLSRRRMLVTAFAATLSLGVLVPGIAAAEQLDTDADGLFDADEIGYYLTDANNADSDGDSLSDGEEVYFGTNPLVANAAPMRADSDGDGLFDDDEQYVYGTNPAVTDSDADGVNDGEEVYLGTDPAFAPGPKG